jgi:hypothetical protein
MANLLGVDEGNARASPAGQNLPRNCASRHVAHFAGARVEEKGTPFSA